MPTLPADAKFGDPFSCAAAGTSYNNNHLHACLLLCDGGSLANSDDLGEGRKFDKCRAHYMVNISY